MAEVITIRIDLDSSGVDTAFDEVEKKAQSAGQNIENSFNIQVQNKIDSFSNSLIESTNAFDKVTDSVGELILTVGGLGGTVFAVQKRLFGLTRTLPQIQRALFANNKTFFGTVSALGLVGSGALLLSKSLEGVENDLLRVVKATSLFVALLAGGLAAGIGFAIISIGNLAFEVGTNLVRSFQNAVQTFINAESSLNLLTTTVENFNRVSDQSVGSLRQYNALVEELSDNFNLSRESLRRASAEIVTVGSRLGLNAVQLEKLVRASAAYAKINGKDVFDVSVRLVQALNGQSQSVAALGVKLNEASNASKALRLGFDRSFASLDDGSKVQVRFNNLISQYEDIAGLAAAQAGTLADQQARFEVNTEKLNAALGRGAALIENNNLLTAALNVVLNNVNEGLISAAGFFGALGARLLQVGGIVLKFSFQVIAVTKALKVLNILLAEERVQQLFSQRIAFLGRSLDDLIASFAGAPVKIRSVNDTFSVLGRGIRLQVIQLASFVSGVNAANLSLTAFATGALAKARAALVAFGTALAPVLTALAPFIAAGAAIVSAFLAIREAILQLEARTGAFTRLFAVIRDEISATTGFLSDFRDFFVRVFDGLQTAFNTFIGILVVGIGKLVALLISAINKIPFNLVSKRTKLLLEDIQRDVDGFSDRLIAAGFDISKFGQTSVASLNEVSKAFKATLDDVRKLQRELADVGKTDLQILEEELANRLKILRSAREQELISEKEFLTLKRKAFLDFNDKFIEDLKSNLDTQRTEIDRAQRDISQNLQRGIIRTIQAVGEEVGRSLAGAASGFEAFKNTILGIIGDLAIQLGTTFIAIGLGIDAIKASTLGLTGAPAVAAGFALIALGSALKSFAGGNEGETPTAASGTQPALEPGPTDPVTDPEDVGERSRVTVNIRGDVLDSDETGTRIAKILQDSFESEGVTVVRGA